MTNNILFRRDGTRYVGRTVTENTTVGYTARVNCHRCAGAGGYKGWPGFTCFECGGQRQFTKFYPLYTEKKLAQLVAAQARREAVKLAKAAAAQVEREAAIIERRAAFEAQYADLLTRVTCLGLTNPAVLDICDRADRDARLTDAQAALLVSACERAEALTAAAARSTHVATIGERIEVRVTVERVATYERAAYRSYGAVETVYVTTMVDAAGNQIVAKSPRFSEEKGATFTLRATVKEHSTYQGVPQTVVERAKALDVTL